MTTASISPGQVSASPSPWLWAVIAALAATTVALGASLWQMRTQSVQAEAPQSLIAESLPAAQASPAPQTKTLIATVPVDAPTAVSKPKVAPAPVQQAQTTIKKVAPVPAATKAAPLPDVAPVSPSVEASAAPSAPAPTPVVRAVCTSCGTVEGVIAVQQPGTSSGVGAVAGAALGGLVGNQVGGGTGKTIATLLGVVGGSMAGDAVEKRMKHETRYRVDVRMEDGSLRSIQQAQPAMVGERVTLDGDTLRAAR